MSNKVTAVANGIAHVGKAAARSTGQFARAMGRGLYSAKGGLLVLGALGALGYALYTNPPLHTIPRGEVGMRLNQITGASTEVRDGAVLVVPGLHALRRFSLRDQTYRPTANLSANGPAPFQSVEGLSVGVDVSVRYALDPDRKSVV